LHSSQSQVEQLRRNRKTIDERKQEKRVIEDHITKKDDYIATLELQLKNTQSMLKQNEKAREYLQKTLDEQVNINKQVTVYDQNKVNRLLEELKKNNMKVTLSAQNSSKKLIVYKLN